MAYWLFQGNPKYYQVRRAIADFEEMPWLTTRYAKTMELGDKVLVWIAGANAGIYAIAEITELPKIRKTPPDREYWLDKTRLGTKPQAMLKFKQKLLDTPLLRQNLKQDPILQHLLVIRAPNSTNFKVTPEQWQRVQTLIEEG
ncbi:EVE domain-containing protein [Spirulina sp. CS-785/01]|uniref:EVE domain-containing protein n=1 Tax=Spirulina sp. CS-785/01 TaxID=3021716 RepID=UPI002330C635|nr:EVE domain-containing protein [Spirulina sp. CS-785/01]MDB9312632.1 EVE domain-containing protein [Spirulina sp. CS-785/01]